MNSTTQTLHHPLRSSAFKWIATSSAMEAIVAIAVIALSIVGLAGVNPLLMAAIATIIAGAAILMEGGGFEMASAAVHANRSANLTANLSAGFLGAVAGIILGILALLNVEPVTLLSVAVLVFGVTFFLSSTMTTEQSRMDMQTDGFLLLGLSVSVLGLLAVIGISSSTLVLVGLLVLGAASLIGGSIRGAKALPDAAS